MTAEDERLFAFWRDRAKAAEAWYREEYDVDPCGEGIDIVYPWDHVGNDLDMRPDHTGDTCEQATSDSNNRNGKDV